MNRIAELKPATYQDILDAPDGMIAEIIEGRLSLQPRGTDPHTKVIYELTVQLGMTFDRGIGGPGGWKFRQEPEIRFPDENVYVPDFAGWQTDAPLNLREDLYTKDIPNWVCEVHSPSTRGIDRGPKRDVYARHGIEFLWFVDPEDRSVEAYALQQGMWVHQGTGLDDDNIALPPFEQVPFNLGILWT